MISYLSVSDFQTCLVKQKLFQEKKMSKALFIVLVIITSSGLANPQTFAHRKLREFILDISGRTINEPRLLHLAENNNVRLYMFEF